jgi:BirA family biotin operon repressor/biotin-[acetyl-CoA-carboxylase] ligase
LDTSDAAELGTALAPLIRAGELPLAELALDAGTLIELGFEVAGDRVRVPPDVERLSRSRIETVLGGRARSWLRDLTVLDIVGSTSTLVGEMAAARSVDGVVRLAELQVSGRGRRGRGWLSPYGRNLALSAGIRLPRSPDGLGGFSLAVGLAVAEALDSQGVADLQLKWPNDVLVAGRKIAGILVEIYSGAAGTEVVVGIGINFDLSEAVRRAIDQPVTDLVSLGHEVSRNRLAAALLSSLADAAEGFAGYGFAPLRETFDALHLYHNRECQLLIGTERVQGTVRGVSATGELLLEIGGHLGWLGAGEVSLRAAPQRPPGL